MANSYQRVNWPGTLQADIKGDVNNQATLDDNFDVALASLKKKKKAVDNILTNLKKEVTSLKTHQDTGKLAESYLGTTIKRIEKMHSALVSEINTISNAVSKTQKEEYLAMKKAYQEWLSKQN